MYFAQEGKNYAIIDADTADEIPVSFKAEKNGSYTLSFTHEKVSLNYLHLIDNLTGADIDLLQNPSYSFNAKTTDHANRFKLVFGTGQNDDHFAFMSNGEIMINGTGTIQIIDVLERTVFTQKLSTRNSQLSTRNFTPGEYVLRLINGDTVRVQKIVIKWFLIFQVIAPITLKSFFQVIFLEPQTSNKVFVYKN